MTKDWLVSGGGPVTMLFSVVAILGITVYLYGFKAAHVDLQGLMAASPPFRNVTDILGAIGAAGAVLIYFSMWFYWARIDESSGWKKRFWFLVLLLGLWYGSCLYYFAVYRPQVTAFRNGATA
jgi:hypothetical protein